MEPVHCCLQGRHNRKPSRYSTNMEVLVKVLKKGLLYSCRLKMYCRQRGNTRAASGQERKCAIQVLPQTLYTELNAILSAAKVAHDNTILVYFNFIIMYNDSTHLYTRLRLYMSYFSLISTLWEISCSLVACLSLRLLLILSFHFGHFHFTPNSESSQSSWAPSRVRIWSRFLPRGEFFPGHDSTLFALEGSDQFLQIAEDDWLIDWLPMTVRFARSLVPWLYDGSICVSNIWIVIISTATWV